MLPLGWGWGSYFERGACFLFFLFFSSLFSFGDQQKYQTQKMLQKSLCVKNLCCFIMSWCFFFSVRLQGKPAYSLSLHRFTQLGLFCFFCAICASNRDLSCEESCEKEQSQQANVTVWMNNGLTTYCCWFKRVGFVTCIGCSELVSSPKPGLAAMPANSS